MLNKFLKMFALLSMSNSLMAADMPADTPDVLRHEEYFRRCSNDTPEDVTDCIEISLGATCISEDIRIWAIEHSLGVACYSEKKIMAVCPCSCFEKGTKISYFHPDLDLLESKAVESIRGGDFVATLGEFSSLSSVDLEEKMVSYATSGPEEPELFVFNLEDGGSLAVTETHALLLADGRMVAAQKVSLQDSLVSESGKGVKIKNISRRKTDTVYNFLVETPNKNQKGHVISANGYLVGDMAWQNALGNELNRVLLRK